MFSRHKEIPAGSMMSNSMRVQPYTLERLRTFINPAARSLRGARIFFDGQMIGDYSLAIVNRLLIRALLVRGLDITVRTEEPGWRSDPMLAQFPDVRQRCVEAYPETGSFDFHLRNSWPPKVDDMIGAKNVYACFAWEESDFPPNWVDRFNNKLDLITVTSNFVERCLRHSGVRVPIAVAGNGSDHASDVGMLTVRSPIPRSEKFRFLHVSSCFPRKGADVLVKAFARAFDKRQPVELLIKTFPNPHNLIEQQIAQTREKYPEMAQIRVVNQSYAQPQLLALVKEADALVAPSRGEGFCLPAAEALMLGVPVIVTGFGGQMDFCGPDSAFLVDYHLSASATHLAGPYSTWAEPSEESLIEQMRLVFKNRKLAHSRVRKGVARLKNRFKWQDVADRTVSALRSIGGNPADRLATATRVPSIDLVSTWRQSCGIASYSQHLFHTNALGPLLKTIIAREIIDDALPADVISGPDTAQSKLERLWRTDSGGIDRLSGRIARGSGDILWMQHHPGFFSNADMDRVARSLRSSGYRTAAITLHNTNETLGAGPCDWLNAFGVVFVHTPKDAAMLSMRRFNHCAVIPHGFLPSPATNSKGRSDSFTVGTFGFLYPHKNLCGLIQGIARARAVLPDIRLKALTCVRTDWRSQVERARVEILAERLGIDDAIEFCFDYLDEQDIIERLSECDLLCFLYQESSESTTGAVRVALAANRPVLCSKSSVLADLAEVAHVLRTDSPDAVADSLILLAGHSELRNAHDVERRQWLGWYGYERAAERYRGHLDYLLTEKHRGRVGMPARSELKRLPVAA
jgi:glycosyltransferase involved in cell wall biosynthesis